jgi:hypothetical protein
MPWAPWEMDVSHRLEKENKLYTYSDVAFATGTDASTRFSYYGSVGCTVEGASAEDQIFGILYATTTIELIEFCPITSSAPGLASRLIPRLAVRAKSSGGSALLEANSKVDSRGSTRESLEKLAKLGLLHGFVRERKLAGKWIPAIPESLLKLSRHVEFLNTQADQFTKEASAHTKSHVEVSKRPRLTAKFAAIDLDKDPPPRVGQGDVT